MCCRIATRLIHIIGNLPHLCLDRISRLNEVDQTVIVPLGSGAIKSTVRLLTDLRLKGASTFWEEANAEAVIELQAAVLSGRWDQVLDRTRAATMRDRRTDWRWEPLACLAELKALDDQDEGSPQPSTKKHSKRTAA